MDVRQRAILVILALLVPGTIAYVAVRTMVNPGREYVILPPQSPVSDEPAIVHGRDTFTVAPQPQQMPEGQGQPVPPAAGVNPQMAPSSQGNPPAVKVNIEKAPPVVNQPGQPMAGKPSRLDARQPGRPAGEDMKNSPFVLVRFVLDIGRMEEARKVSLTSSQAKAILAVIKPLSAKKSLSSSQVATAVSKLNAQLTKAQRASISKMAMNMPQPPGGQAGGSGDEQAVGVAERPSGEPSMGPPPGAGEAPKAGQRPPMDSNPLNPIDKNPMAKQIQAIIKMLQAKAK
ncbi:MAG: hypothetical protein ABFD49_09760 [Armatimonadota bacterium]|nr:hypothetical protein [bacterium]